VEQDDDAQAARPAARLPDPGSRLPAGEDKQRKRRLAALEAEVALLEQELGRLRGALDKASASQDVKKLTALGTQYAELEHLLAEKYAQWEQLSAA
jgi:ATP-binding cassette subfamily F protein 3